MSPVALAGTALMLAGQVSGVVVFGGGWGPDGTQSSIEADVRRLARLRPGSTVLFGGGRDGRTVQTATAPDAVAYNLGLLFGRRDGLSVAYRATHLHPDGPATADRVTEAVVALAARPGGGIAFGAGHGGPAAEDRSATLELWGGPLTVDALASALDGATARGPLALVLGQCHSGAFADIAHVGGDPRRAAAKPARCVLAAAPAELEAAGCSPDAGDPAAQAFLFAMNAALRERVDYNRDGQTGLDEALAYARLHDRTVDVPVKSSELWLERQLGDLPVLEGVSQNALLKAADPAERAILTSLLPEPAPGKVVVRMDRLIERAQSLELAVNRSEDAFEGARVQAMRSLLRLWPELSNPFHPVARALIAGPAPQLSAFFLTPDFQALLHKDRAWEEQANLRWALERQTARVDRWLRTARAVWGRTMLDPARRNTLDALRACEARTLD